jgi:hypothetical protein
MSVFPFQSSELAAVLVDGDTRLYGRTTWRLRKDIREKLKGLRDPSRASEHVIDPGSKILLIGLDTRYITLYHYSFSNEIIKDDIQNAIYPVSG